jgi:hypothetical protein
MIVYGNLTARLNLKKPQSVIRIPAPIISIPGQPSDSRADDIMHLTFERELLYFDFFTVFEIAHLHLSIPPILTWDQIHRFRRTVVDHRPVSSQTDTC